MCNDTPIFLQCSLRVSTSEYSRYQQNYKVPSCYSTAKPQRVTSHQFLVAMVYKWDPRLLGTVKIQINAQEAKK